MGKGKRVDKIFQKCNLHNWLMLAKHPNIPYKIIY